jgi:hypothetical protein
MGSSYELEPHDLPNRYYVYEATRGINEIETRKPLKDAGSTIIHIVLGCKSSFSNFLQVHRPPSFLPECPALAFKAELR